MEINAVEEAERTPTAVTVTSSNTTRVTAAATKTTKAQKQSNGQPRDATGHTNAAHSNNNNSSLRGRNTTNEAQRHHDGGKEQKRSLRGPTRTVQECDEFTIVNYNVRGINTEEKQRKVYEILGRYRPQIVCLNETKLQSPMFLDRYWSF